MLEITESEMLERYIDSLKKAASRADEFTKTKPSDRPRIFVEFVDALKIAAGSAHQLAHAQMNTSWLDARDILEGVITVGADLPLHSEKDNFLWVKIRESLDMMVVAGRKMATSKAMTKSELDLSLTRRFKALPN